MRTRTLLCLPAILLLASSVHAQIPDSFTNLQILPKDISRSELIGTMREFAFALGVRCSHCHAVSDGLNDESDDFASDEKLAKRRARVMMQMVRAINQDHLPKLPERESPNVGVRCRTCHGGITLPQVLDEVLLGVTLEDGIDAAMARYEELRERYYGRAAYDFGSRTLFLFGEKLVDAGRPGDAIPVFERVLRDDPGSAEAWMNIGAAQAAAGDPQAAIAAYRKVIEMDPDGGWAPVAQRRIDALAPEGQSP
jgi:tetratricopeptide (TPR) repeat protein